MKIVYFQKQILDAVITGSAKPTRKKIIKSEKQPPELGLRHFNF
jgi:hypothetical protein